jgi:hypothetical protein
MCSGAARNSVLSRSCISGYIDNKWKALSKAEEVVSVAADIIILHAENEQRTIIEAENEPSHCYKLLVVQEHPLFSH